MAFVRGAAPTSMLMSVLAASIATAGGQLRPLSHGGAGPGITYDLRFPNAAHHEAEVEARFRGVAGGRLELRMARTSPGRYAAHEFAKNVYALKATDSAGHTLAIDRVAPNVWSIRAPAAAKGADVTVRYTVFADRADGTYSGFDAGQLHIQPLATFLYAPALRERRVSVVIHSPDSSWTAATQLAPTSDPWTFSAPNTDYLFDSPVHVGRLQWREWTVAGATSGSARQTVRLAVDDTTSGEVVDTMQRARGESSTKARQSSAPCRGSTTERTRSSRASAPAAPPTAWSTATPRASHSASVGRAPAAALRSIVHEMFHAWNGKRLRPSSLEPFDLERTTIPKELWFVEGFTNYYADLLSVRAGVTTPAQFARGLTTAVNTMTVAPGRELASALEMSEQAAFFDGGVSVDPDNAWNTYVSQYGQGQSIALALDLALRASGKSSLDSLMRVLWQRFGAPERWYALADLRAAIAAVSSPSVADVFWNRYVAGRELAGFGALLAPFGIAVRPLTPPTAIWFGENGFDTRDGRVVVTALVQRRSPLYAAGIETGDRINEANGVAVRSDTELAEVLRTVSVGDTVRVTYESRADAHQTMLIADMRPGVVVRASEAGGARPMPLSSSDERNGCAGGPAVDHSDHDWGHTDRPSTVTSV